VLYNVDSPDRARRLLHELPASGRLDGLIVITLPLRDDDGERLAEASFPTVLVDTWHPALPSVSIDDVAGGRLATSHLLDLGHERIAFVGEPPRNPMWFVASKLREQGYGEALQRAGVALRPEYVRHGAHLRSAARRMATELFALAEPPTGIVTASDVQATGVLEAAQSTGRRVPEDLGIVGYDDIELAAHIGLTTVRQPLEVSGQRGAEILLGALAASEHRIAPFNEQLPLELVMRRTTGPAPVAAALAPARRIPSTARGVLS
jgi:DNA-binding LacI/PurR family transcriptional regulator